MTSGLERTLFGGPRFTRTHWGRGIDGSPTGRVGPEAEDQTIELSCRRIGEGHAGAIYDATGPKTYGFAERAALASEFLGAPLGANTITPDILRAGLTQAGLPDGVLNLLVGIQRDFVNGSFNIVTGDVEKLAGRPPKDLREVLASYLK
ncbi:MAG: hypothetical protein EON59_06085 [Alphaproteobacteria bacterium]|nr:MAG: hypothetical protein EON59_06085 [Alphaproteobacteria bacterium]